MDKIKLFCLPFAGGSKSAYHPFIRMAPEYLEVIPVELPGRGSRYRELLLSDVHSMVDDILQQINHHLHKPYALYGHSMGALLSFVFAHRVAEQGKNQPLHLFLTGREGPSVQPREKIYHLLDTDELVSELREMGGIPREI